jgi:hypothetical protein
MKGLLVRVAADKTDDGGRWNAPVDSKSHDFVYVSIREKRQFCSGIATPYNLVVPHLGGRWPCLPKWLVRDFMHLDPDFEHLTYRDSGNRANQIREKLRPGDLLVFYAGLKDVRPAPRLVYAIIGLYEIDEIVERNSAAPDSSVSVAI